MSPVGKGVNWKARILGTLAVVATVTVGFTGYKVVVEDNPPSPEGVCLVSNRADWALAGTDCSFGATLTFNNGQQWLCTTSLASIAAAQGGSLPLKVIWNFAGAANNNPSYGDQGVVRLQPGCFGDGNSDTIDVIVEMNGNFPYEGGDDGSAGGAAKFQAPPGARDIQITGNFECGPVAGAAHQDVWQLQNENPNPNSRLDIVNATAGDYDAGTGGCIGAGGSVFWSSPNDVDVYGGEFVSCNHGLNGNAGRYGDGNFIIDAKFRTGRVEAVASGGESACAPGGLSGGSIVGSPPCINTQDLTLQNVTCEQWNASTNTWQTSTPTP